MSEYVGVVTAVGQQKLAAAIGGTALNLTTIMVGDGNGAPIAPHIGMTDLVRRVGVAYPIISSGRDPVNLTHWRVTALIPAADGPFDIREIAVFDAVGDMIAIAKHVLVEKRSPAQGAAIELTTDIVFPVSETAQVTVQIQPSAAVSILQMLRAGFCVVESAQVANPPANPALGVTYVVAAAATGAWVGLTNRLVQWNGTVWVSIDPPQGFLVIAQDRALDHPGRWLRRIAGGWVSASATREAFGVVRRATAAEAAARADVNAFVAPSDIQVPLVAPRTLFVRANGNDLNDGSANTDASAFRTINAAIQFALRVFAPSRHLITIQIADGLYAEAVVVSQAVGWRFMLLGNEAAPQNVIIRAPAGSIAAVLGETLANIDVVGVQIEAVAGATFVNGLMAQDRSRLVYRNVRFGANLFYQVSSARSSVMTQNGPVTIVSGGAAHLVATSQGSIQNVSQAISYIGAPAFSVANVWANNGTVVVASVVFSGAVNGPRYQADVVGLIWTAGAGVNFIPGSVAGNVNSGGVYA